jgi:hypothetical protein
MSSGTGVEQHRPDISRAALPELAVYGIGHASACELARRAVTAEGRVAHRVGRALLDGVPRAAVLVAFLTHGAVTALIADVAHAALLELRVAEIFRRADLIEHPVSGVGRALEKVFAVAAKLACFAEALLRGLRLFDFEVAGDELTSENRKDGERGYEESNLNAGPPG